MEYLGTEWKTNSNNGINHNTVHGRTGAVITVKCTLLFIKKIILITDLISEEMVSLLYVTSGKERPYHITKINTVIMEGRFLISFTHYAE